MPLKRLGIEPTNICQLNCDHCWSRSTKKQKGFMDFDFYSRLIKEASQIGIQSIMLNYSGEPTLHPRFGDMIRECTKYNIPVAYATNGLIMTDDILNALSTAKVNGINFSLHWHKNYDKVFSNIRQVLKVVPEKSVGATIELGEYPIDSPVEHLQDCPVKITLKPMIIGMSWQKLPEGTKAIANDACHIHRSTYILYDGSVTLCCRDIACEQSFGDVNKNGILNTWNSPEYVQKRIAVSNKSFINLPLCQRCNLWKLKIITDEKSLQSSLL